MKRRTGLARSLHPTLDPRLPTPHSPLLTLVGLLVLALAGPSRGERPADRLFRLVPPEALAALAIEDLRGQRAALLEAPLAQELAGLPGMRAWLQSPEHRKLERASAGLESALGLRLPTLLDDLLGDAVVLALSRSVEDPPDQARGLLLTRVRSRKQLDHFIERINALQKQEKKLQDVTARTRRGVTYWARHFQAGTRPDDYYAVLKDDVFAWSNSEASLQGAIDRQGEGGPGLAGESRFRAVRARLPERSIAWLWIDPRTLAELPQKGPRAKAPANDPVSSALRHYLGALDGFGAALEWRDGFLLQTREILNPSRIDPALRSALASTTEVGSVADRVPPTALAVVALGAELPALFDWLVECVPEESRGTFANLEMAARGLLLGRDPRTEVLPGLGKTVLAYVDVPEAEGPMAFPWVVRVSLAPGEAGARAGAALENAVGTVLALSAAAPERKASGWRVEIRPGADASTTVLVDRGGTILLAAARGPAALAVGAPLTAVVGAAASSPSAGGGSTRLQGFQAAHFPRAQSFVFLDLRGWVRAMRPRQAEIARWLAAQLHESEQETARDLDRFLAVADLFECAFLATTVAPGATAIDRTLGLMARSTRGKPD